MDHILSEMTFETLGQGEFTASLATVQNVLDNPNVTLLDVRTDIEAKHCDYPFTLRIPLDELPDRISELSRDAMIITFAGSTFQAAVGCFYLRQAGFESVKTLVAGSEQIATILKPTPLFNRQN